MWLIAVVLLLAGCSDQGPSVPPDIVIKHAAYSSGPYGLDVVTTLRNIGGAGEYRLDFWALPNEPSGSPRLIGGTDAVGVPAGYLESVTWRAPDVRYPGPTLTHIAVYVRGPGVATWTRGPDAYFRR